MDMFSKNGLFPKKHHRCISLESGQALTKKSYPKTPLELPRFFPRRYSTPELAMRKHALRHERDSGEQPISNKSCQTDILGLDKYLQRSSGDTSLDAADHSSSTTVRTYRKPPKRPKVRSVAVHCERRRLSFAAFKGCQKFKHVYKRKISLPQPSRSPSSSAASEGRRDRVGGVLPKLRPDRATAAAAGDTTSERPAAVKLPRIPTRDAKQGPPDRADDGPQTRLARLRRTAARPRSTGSGSGNTDCRKSSVASDFRASSAPRIDSRHCTLLRVASSPPERGEPSTAESSDTANTMLDVSFVRRQLRPEDEGTAGTATTAAAATATRNASTSTTFPAAEPVFPIVFSCESVLRHPLDGGYVSHTESHRFSVHYVPVDDADGTATSADGDEGTARSSLVFASAGTCQNERCQTGDSVLVTFGKPAPSSSAANAVGERRLVVGRQHTDDVRFENVSPNETVDRDRRNVAETDGNALENGDKKTVLVEGLYVLGKGDTINHGADVYEKPAPPTNQIIDAFVDDGEGAVLKSHAHTDVPLRSDERNYVQLTQNQHDSDRTVSNQSPKFDCTITRLAAVERQNDLEPDDNNTHAIELESSHTNIGPVKRVTNSTDRQEESVRQPIVDDLQDTIEQLHENTTMASHCHHSSGKLRYESTEKHKAEQSNNSKLRHHGDTRENTNRSMHSNLPHNNNHHESTEKHRAEQLIKSELRHHGDTRENTNRSMHSNLPHNNNHHESTEKHRAEQSNNSKLKHHGDTRENTNRSMHSNLPHNNNHHESTEKHRAEQFIKSELRHHGDTRENTNRSMHSNLPHNNHHHESTGKHSELISKQPNFPEHTNMGRKPNDNYNKEHFDRNHNTTHLIKTVHSNSTNQCPESIGKRDNHSDGMHAAHSSCRHMYNTMHSNSLNYHYEPTGKRANEMDIKHTGQSDANNTNSHNFSTHHKEEHGIGSRQHANPHVRVEENNTNTCRRCTNSLLHKNNEMKNELKHGSGVKVDESEDFSYRSMYENGQNHYSMPKHRLESVDESTESKESNYIGGSLFGDVLYKKQPQNYDPDRPDNEHNGYSKYEYYDDSKKVNFSSKPSEHYKYYQDYAPKTRHSPRDEDCTVFAADAQRHTNSKSVQHDQYSAAAQTPYYSQLDKTYTDDKNTDSDESLTDSLEDSKCEGTAISYFLALNGQKSAVTFTLKMPNTLESRLNRRQSLLKKHLHVSTTVRKTSTRVRIRHKGCQTLWTEEKGVQVQRGSTANAKKHAVDDHKVLETLLAGLDRNRVSENQIRVIGGQKMVSEGNQTEQMPEPPSDRQTQTTRDAAAGPSPVPPVNGPKEPTTSKGQNKAQSHAVKKFSADNALMVGVVRQNKYKGKEALDGNKNDQLLTLSKGWINFYTLRADSVDTDAQELLDNDDEVKHEDDSQQYTVHVQAVPEPVTLPIVHVPNRNTLQVPKTCSAAKHLPRIVQTETNHCPSHMATTNGWCVSVDGPNNMHMKVSLLPDKSEVKTSEHLDLNEENKLDARRLALQRKNNYMRKPYRTIKRTQSTPRDMFSADVSRTESALSAESKYIETIDTQLLIHKARRRLSQEWDTRIQNGGVTESVQLVVTGDSVSSRTTQHYATKGHQHCSFRRQSRRI